MNTRDTYFSILIGLAMIAIGLYIKTWWGALGLLTVFNSLQEIRLPALSRLRRVDESRDSR